MTTPPNPKNAACPPHQQPHQQPQAVPKALEPDLGTTSVLLRLGLTHTPRRIDDLVKRLEHPDGHDWFRRAVATFAPPGEDAFDLYATPRFDRSQLEHLKRSFKDTVRDSSDPEARLRSLLGYALTVAAAAIHHKIILSSQGPSEVAEVLGELGTVAPEPWDDFLGRAALAATRRG